MKPWLFYSLLTILFWGGMGFGGKLASRSISVQHLPLFGALGGLLVFGAVLAASVREWKWDWGKGDSYVALGAGVIGAAGTVCFYMAIARGEGSRVGALTATYPLVMLLLSLFFLGESVSATKLLGVALAVAGICLLSIK